ncbi:MAG TPA: hypothetical protein VJ001_10920 [Rhodocyclaceae bacterium]|nr:hypothetical protein [Rhodocyclaceae bacterium]
MVDFYDEQLLRRCGVNESGLWSMSRGFAKSADEYKARLAAADEPRMGDLDGRGHLSEQRLAEFCAYSARTAVDQANYMAKAFAIDDVKTRINAYFQRVRLDLKPESAHLFLHVFAMGTMERMEAGRVAGLAERTARDVLTALLAEGLMRSDTPKGRVRVGFPLHAVGYLFPNLYPAGSSDALPPSPSTPNSTGVLT